MHDGWKSVAVALVIIFVYTAVLGGQPLPRDGWIGGRRGWTFCESLGDWPLVGALPCWAINWGVLAATFAALIMFGVVLMALRRSD